MRTIVVAAVLLLSLAYRVTLADGEVPPALSARLEILAPGMKPDHVAATALPGMYEVRFGSIIVYLSKDGRYMLRGDLIDLDAGRNVTEAARRTMRAEAMGELGESSMIVFAPDTVKHTITVFTDVDCPYCARMHEQMADYNRLGIAIRYTAFPRAGVGSATYDKMVSVWCADDQRGAMTDTKAGVAVKPARCDNPVERHYEAGKAVGVTGTPAIVLKSGTLIPGYVPPEELLGRLEERESG